MQNPRGSNDRLNEANTNRNNGNRLFDSQNNGKGGYCVGPAMSFYAGSILSVEWTAQHGCGENPKLQCNMVLQYMCEKTDAPAEINVRDGATTNTIGENLNDVTETDNNGGYEFGMHESYQYWENCKTRDRNMGLFIADRENQGNLNTGRSSARFTRQNNDGTRRGFECAEERDYYPYWHPSPWRDIAILAQNEDDCSFYQSESQNVKAKNRCQDSTQAEGVDAKQNNEVACLAANNKWVEVPSFNMSAPTCYRAPLSRDNHLGNGADGFANSFNWTIPDGSDEKCIDDDNCNCVLRIRYNITTGDLDAKEIRPGKGTGTINGNAIKEGFIDAAYNKENSPVTQDPIVLQNGKAFELALDTSQFGRTFQDRTHVFHIKKRPSGVNSNSRIFNLNVRGKRGTIVETYPATEYDFVPERLFVRANDYIHFQWTGCDTNPNGNAGEGTAGTDRSNMVQMARLQDSYPASDAWIQNVNGSGRSDPLLFESDALRMRMSYLDQTGCKTETELNNEGNRDQNVKNCFKLNAAPRYFDGGLIKMNTTGEFFYMSTRNNNFSNRGQKGMIKVDPLLPGWAIGILVAGSVLFVGAGGVAGAMFYAKSHPHSSVANFMTKF
jgi:hypothetical protein